MAAGRLILILAACLLIQGDRAAPSWETAYDQAIQQLNHAQFESARVTAQSAYRQWCGSAPSRPCALLRIALAESLIELDRGREAVPLLDVPVPYAEEEARRFSDLAMAHLRNQEIDLASQYLAKAVGAVPARARELQGKIDLIGGILQMRSDKLPDAESSFRRAITAVEGSNSLMETYALVDLGFVDLQSFRYDESLYWFGRARDLARKNGMRRALELALENLGAAFLNLGDYDRAIQNLNDAVTLAEGLHDRTYQMSMLVLLGETWAHSGNLVKAAECYEKARQLGNPEHDRKWLASVLDDLSEIALLRGDLASASQLNAQGAALAEQLKSAQPVLTHRIRFAEIAYAHHDYPTAERAYTAALAASLQAGDPIAAFRCKAGLASLYKATGAASAAEREYRAAAALMDQEHAKLSLEESKFSFVSGMIDFYREYVDFLFDRGDEAGAFRVAESRRASVLEEKLRRDTDGHAAVDLEALAREARASGTVLMSYWLAPRRSLLWVIDSSGLHSFLLPPEDQIADAVRRYNDSIQRGENPLDTGNETGRWLFTNLLSAHYRLPKDSRVVIEPDGVLHQLNFESLPAGDGRHYWIEDATVSLAPSLAVLRSVTYVPAHRLLAFGDPGFEGTEFQGLTHVKEELDAVARHYAEKAVYVSSRATPAAYLGAHAENYSILHFATHAVANRESPLDSAIVLAGPADSRKLYARQILRQPLTADLVTLSACQTAGSRTYYGEGLTGFSWAFLSAGARNVVAGLWEVDDRATAALMTGFYDELSSGLPPVDALRRAKLRLMASGGAYRKPRYWAAFETFSSALYR